MRATSVGVVVHGLRRAGRGGECRPDARTSRASRRPMRGRREGYRHVAGPPPRRSLGAYLRHVHRQVAAIDRDTACRSSLGVEAPDDDARGVPRHDVVPVGADDGSPSARSRSLSNESVIHSRRSVLHVDQSGFDPSDSRCRSRESRCRSRESRWLFDHSGSHSIHSGSLLEGSVALRGDSGSHSSHSRSFRHISRRRR